MLRYAHLFNPHNRKVAPVKKISQALHSIRLCDFYIKVYICRSRRIAALHGDFILNNSRK